jgi:hypothetical protein
VLAQEEVTWEEIKVDKAVRVRFVQFLRICWCMPSWKDHVNCSIHLPPTSSLQKMYYLAAAAAHMNV